MKKTFLATLCLLLSLLRIIPGAEAQENLPPPRVLFNVDAGAPFMLTNTLQREFFRGLVYVNPSFAFRLAGRFYPGLDMYYGVWQSVNPYKFKDATRDVVMHHAGGGLSLGYLFKTGSKQVDIYARLCGGYTQMIFSGVAKGLDTSVYANPVNRKFLNSFFVGPSATLFLYLDDDQRGAAGFHLGARFLPYQLTRELLYLDKNSDYSATRDTGPTLHINFGISFSYKLGRKRTVIVPEG